MRTLLFIIFSCLALLAKVSAKPNLVYVICDDLGYGDVKCLNPKNGKIPTPHVDKLASEGMIFTEISQLK